MTWEWILLARLPYPHSRFLIIVRLIFSVFLVDDDGNKPRTLAWSEAERLKSALRIASGKQGLINLLLQHIISLSVVALGKMEQINAFPSRLITNGQQMVASPMVAASSGTGTMYRTWENMC
jgi:hypothetical protein